MISISRSEKCCVASVSTHAMTQCSDADVHIVAPPGKLSCDGYSMHSNLPLILKARFLSRSRLLCICVLFKDRTKQMRHDTRCLPAAMGGPKRNRGRGHNRTRLGAQNQHVPNIHDLERELAICTPICNHGKPHGLSLGSPKHSLPLPSNHRLLPHKLPQSCSTTASGDAFLRLGQPSLPDPLRSVARGRPDRPGTPSTTMSSDRFGMVWTRAPTALVYDLAEEHWQGQRLSRPLSPKRKAGGVLGASVYIDGFHDWTHSQLGSRNRACIKT